MMEEQFGWRVAEACPNALRVLDTEDLQCLRSARHNAVKQNRNFTYNDLQTDLAKREIASIYRCDLSLIISDFEKNLLTDYFEINQHLLIHLPFMVDLNRIEEDMPSYSERINFVTIGNLRHAPNWDSILYLQEIWPLIRTRLPKAQMHIYGAYTPPKATALDDPKNGFMIRDRVENASMVMKDARVCLSPLRFGAGIKGKFIEAMLTSTPSVTTSIGSEGMSSEKDWPGLVANDPQKIADAAVSLYENEHLWTQQSQQCTNLLKKSYCEISNGRKLLNSINYLVENIDTHRQRNFVGSILNFHAMRSTKYMSKWIEEKNRNVCI
jgi:glycosyltransferase involved in cell wall biosynthesis